VQEWHGIRDTVLRDTAGTVLHQEPRKGERTRRDVGRNRKAAATSEKPEDIRHCRQEVSYTGNREASNRIFRQHTKNEHQDIVEGSDPSETEK
jgi:hypothetical protein